jgi:hypothetical protein
MEEFWLPWSTCVVVAKGTALLPNADTSRFQHTGAATY